MQYESNPANGFRDIVRKQNTDARPDMVMTISPPLLRGRGIKKIDVSTLFLYNCCILVAKSMWGEWRRKLCPLVLSPP